MPSVLFVTLGCAKNEVDTDRMRALLLRGGFREVEEVEDASLVIINTCSFLASATEESIECTLELAEGVREGVRSCPIVMCGCVPSRYGSDLPNELPEVSAFVRTDEEDDIVSVCRRVLGLPEQEAKPLASVDDLAGESLRTICGTSAYVKISDGCDRFCAFCAIPYIRGRYHSRPYAEIAQEVSSLMEGGTREVVLIGQDTGVWGCDLSEGDSLASLLRRLATLVAPYGGWLRVLYLQPEGMTDELVSVIRDVPEVLPYIDIPIQHCSERILTRMNRSGSSEEYGRLFERLRSEIPGMVLRTTALVGFPGETDDEVDELVGFLEHERVDYCSVFSYSPEEGTVASRMEDQIPDDVKLERTQRLIDTAEQLGFDATARHVGETCEVIIDGVESTDTGDELIGHTWFQAPDSDGAVHIVEGSVSVGDVVTCRLTDSFCYELEGELVGGDHR
ncbi:MAG: 30S ribosomal protein S12 methylthiotransferase RimO [Atopobiaceae bacterium]|nr:30S ribosomal protein S12 methylthiotransferase RimO [Atopobiaceae bacterium]MCI1226351.1 30S ribosomal protein S12 methylthiotransferase RimO [Atopobiaceae bacterium]MCI1260441.1 30S ribosomal protein S12 methylthiotransferase RimO [Atopobiaceae bacterium]MDD3177561.1 30S ribosomal protein S12 methylthiotransferase RimO [Atopobiaceae bacterium]MDD4381464.1 30S ribosomal protein S12 methylthiotransferase RimO [Atopobiaceae bacterium]